MKDSQRQQHPAEFDGVLQVSSRIGRRGIVAVGTMPFFRLNNPLNASWSTQRNHLRFPTMAFSHDDMQCASSLCYYLVTTSMMYIGSSRFELSRAVSHIVQPAQVSSLSETSQLTFDSVSASTSLAWTLLLAQSKFRRRARA